MSGFRIRALPGEVAARIRNTLRDEYGNEAVVRVDPAGGSPCRHCLTDAKPGERMALFAYSPINQPGPYKEVGPVFVHADGCKGYHANGAYPEGFRHRKLVFRAYNARGEIHAAEIDAERAPERVIASLFADPEVEFIHARNVGYGCYMFCVERA